MSEGPGGQYDSVLKSRIELSSENRKTAAKLIDASMNILKYQKTDPKTGFRTAYIMTRKIIGDNFLTRKVDTSKPRFYVMIRDLKAADEFSSKKEGLVINFKKTGINLEPMGEDMFTLPRDSRFTDIDADLHLSSLAGKGQNWDLVNELVQDLQSNSKFRRKDMLIEKELYEKRTR